MKKNAVGTLEGEQLELYQALCRHLKVKPLPVLLADSLPSPCLVGVVKPAIALRGALVQSAGVGRSALRQDGLRAGL